jgi:hypothetical protein
MTVEMLSDYKMLKAASEKNDSISTLISTLEVIDLTMKDIAVNWEAAEKDLEVLRTDELFKTTNFSKAIEHLMKLRVSFMLQHRAERQIIDKCIAPLIADKTVKKGKGETTWIAER